MEQQRRPCSALLRCMGCPPSVIQVCVTGLAGLVDHRQSAIGGIGNQGGSCMLQQGTCWERGGSGSGQVGGKFALKEQGREDRGRNERNGTKNGGEQGRKVRDRSGAAMPAGLSWLRRVAACVGGVAVGIRGVSVGEGWWHSVGTGGEAQAGEGGGPRGCYAAAPAASADCSAEWPLLSGRRRRQCHACAPWSSHCSAARWGGRRAS